MYKLRDFKCKCFTQENLHLESCTLFLKHFANFLTPSPSWSTRGLWILPNIFVISTICTITHQLFLTTPVNLTHHVDTNQLITVYCFYSRMCLKADCNLFLWTSLQFIIINIIILLTVVIMFKHLYNIVLIAPTILKHSCPQPQKPHIKDLIQGWQVRHSPEAIKGWPRLHMSLRGQCLD